MPESRPAPFAGKTTERNRKAGNALGILGLCGGILAAGAVTIGSALPWATLTLFGIRLELPGLMGLWGASAVGLAVLALTVRSFPWLWLALGVVCAGIGNQAEKTVGREVVGFKLRVQSELAPVNSRLAQAALPPIEPFTGIGPARDHLGPGPGWTLWGGAALALSGGLRIVGERLRRTCGVCRAAWASERSGLAYCPGCGAPTTSRPHCASCRQPMEEKDRFCPGCGVAAAP